MTKIMQTLKMWVESIADLRLSGFTKNVAILLMCRNVHAPPDSLLVALNFAIQDITLRLFVDYLVDIILSPCLFIFNMF